MASPNVAPSSLPYPSGNVVLVTQVLPVAPSMEQQPSLDERHRFRKGHPKALGTVQIMIGGLTLLFGIATAVHQPSLGVYSGIFVWGALIYITAGSLTVAAEMYLSRCLINTSMAFNIIAALTAGTGVILYPMDSMLWYDPYGPYDHYYYPGYSAVVAVFQFLELIVSITVAAFACNATCNCCCSCTEEPQTFVQTVENPIITQAPPHFPAASVAPAQPYPPAALNFKSPDDLSSAQPPAYQPV